MLDERPALGAEQLDAAIRTAVLAPSSHNTQPWAFGLEPGSIRLYADRTRALPVNDPDDRELTISCGAALFNLLLALRVSRAEPVAELLPEADDQDLLAVVQLHGGRLAGPEDDLLGAAIGRRHTCRSGFASRAVPIDLLERMTTAAWFNGARLTLVEAAEDRHRLAELAGEGDRMQWADRRWRRELAAWMHPRRRGDGLVAPHLMAPLTHAAIAELDLGSRMARREEESAESAPALAILSTPSDEPHDWLSAGMALQAALLHAAAAGVQAGYLNQPVQEPSLRLKVAALLPGPWLPQVVMRLGYPTRDPEPTPRRAVADVLI